MNAKFNILINESDQHSQDLLISRFEVYASEHTGTLFNITSIHDLDAFSALESEMLGGAYDTIWTNRRSCGGYTDDIIASLLRQKIDTPIIATSCESFLVREFQLIEALKAISFDTIEKILGDLENGILKTQWMQGIDTRKELSEAFLNPPPSSSVHIKPRRKFW